MQLRCLSIISIHIVAFKMYNKYNNKYNKCIIIN